MRYQGRSQELQRAHWVVVFVRGWKAGLGYWIDVSPAYYDVEAPLRA